MRADFRVGTEVARRTLATAGAPAAVRLTPDSKVGRTDRNRLAYVAVEIVDASGRRAPDAALDVSLKIDGRAGLIGFGSANPKAIGSFKSATARTYDGRALAILRSRGRRGDIVIEAGSAPLDAGSARIRLT